MSENGIRERLADAVWQWWLSGTEHEEMSEWMVTGDSRDTAGNIADVIVDAIDWRGLMELLEVKYPSDIFTGASGDTGPQLLRALRELQSANERVNSLERHKRIDRMRLEHKADEIEKWVRLGERIRDAGAYPWDDHECHYCGRPHPGSEAKAEDFHSGDCAYLKLLRMMDNYE